MFVIPVQVRECLTDDAQDMIAAACTTLLQERLKPAIEKDVELLSDSGRDRFFNSSSSIFYRLPKMIASHNEEDLQAAFRQVGS